MSEEAKQYEINSLTDFLKVPEDRLAACVEEFADFVNIVREHKKTVDEMQSAGIPIRMEPPTFIWVDDGKREVLGVTYSTRFRPAVAVPCQEKGGGA